MWKFLIPALFVSTVAFAQAPNQPAQPAQAPQGQPSGAQGQAAGTQGNVTTLNSPAAQTQPGNAADPKMMNRNLAISQIEQALQMLKQNQ